MAIGALSALRRLTIVIAVAIVFVFGLASTVYLSLRSPEVLVPEVVGKDRLEAEEVLGRAGLNFRVRSHRPSNQVKAETVLFQLPRAGEVVKAGQTVAMDLSRSVNEGESSEAVVPEPSPEEKAANQNESTSANENRVRRNKNTNANKNANDNSDANSATRNTNANRQATNKNANTSNVNAGTNRNSNRPTLNINSNSNHSVNQNEGGHPATPKPSPTHRP